MKLGYDLTLFREYGVRSAITVQLRSHPSLLLTGASGTGKSYALKWLIRNLVAEYPVKLTFCNFKRSEDFQFLRPFDFYHTFMDCMAGLGSFYQELKTAQDRDVEFDGTYSILVFDEYPAFILSMSDKKEAERHKAMVSEILMLGRSYGFGVWLIMQRPDSALLTHGARDNFHSAISLGSLSKEAKSMLYSGEDIPEQVYGVGEGVGWVDGRGMVAVKYPRIRDVADLDGQILAALAGRDRPGR